jgi:hypothetical protein
MLSNAAKQANEDRQHADATATTHSVTLSDLAMMHRAIDGKLSLWRELAGTTATHVNAESLGFAQNSNTAEIVYGYCDANKDHFYVYVLNEKPPRSSFIADTEGYAYIKDWDPNSCHPAEWQINDYVRVNEESGWYFGLMTTGKRSLYSTPLPFLRTPTPFPTLTEF